MALPHGGNIYHYSLKYGVPEGKFLDFSASINPLGPSPAAIEALKAAVPRLVNYPDPDCSLLRDALAERHGVGRESLLIGNGSTEFIYLIARALKPRNTLLHAPTFSDYARAAKLSGSRVTYLPLKEKDGFVPDMDQFKAALEGVDLFFLCNPNNPTGVLLERETVLDMLGMARKAGAFMVVDEAFIDYAPGMSVLADAAKRKGVAVLRNFTKFHGMPGLRAGYAAAHRAETKRFMAVKEPWSVNTLAERACTAALSDEVFAARSLRLMEREKAYLYREIGRIPRLRPFPPSANFMLVRLTGRVMDAAGVTGALASNGILIRDCSNFRGLGRRYVRVAVRTRRENAALLDALRRVVSFTPHE